MGIDDSEKFNQFFSKYTNGDVLAPLVVAFTVHKDYFGEAVCGTNACRMMTFTLAQRMDQVTDNNNWNVYKDWTAPLR